MSFYEFGEMFDLLPTEPERNDSKNSKRAINQSPAERDSANDSHHQREWHDQRASNHTEFDNPNVFHRIAQRPDERNGDDEVSERQPIRSIGNEGIFRVRLNQSVEDFSEPMTQSGLFQAATSIGSNDLG